MVVIRRLLFIFISKGQVLDRGPLFQKNLFLLGRYIAHRVAHNFPGRSEGYAHPETNVGAVTRGEYTAPALYFVAVLKAPESFTV